MSRIEPLRPDDWTAAMHLALARFPSAQRHERVLDCLHLLESGAIDPRGIWIARAGDTIRAVQVCVELAGSACLFWVPSSDNDFADDLVQAGLDWARSLGCKVAQAAVAPAELAFAQPLLRCGFHSITRMHLLTHDLCDVPAAVDPALHFENCTSANGRTFADTLERTYDGSLDCPELNGKRTIDDILAGHRGQGKFHPDHWWLTYRDGVPVGVVMLSELPAGAAWELAYLGIVPEHRRLGLGRAMTLHALRALQAQAAAQLLLSVDERNTPALRLYQSLGFVETECSDVLLYFW